MFEAWSINYDVESRGLLTTVLKLVAQDSPVPCGGVSHHHGPRHCQMTGSDSQHRTPYHARMFTFSWHACQEGDALILPNEPIALVLPKEPPPRASA